MTWTLSRVMDKKGGKSKRMRKEESGVRKEGKKRVRVRELSSPLTAKTMTLYLYKYCGRSDAV